MTEPKDELSIEKKIVVAFDMCSSSNILEELVLRQDIKPLRDALINMKKFLRDKSSELQFELYKFIGDGWILLFPEDTEGPALVHFLEELSRLYEREMKKRIIPKLEQEPPVMGLTFGIDEGSLLRFMMMNKQEYIGRPLNIASRLQSSLKDKDKRPAYKVLFSQPAFRRLGLASVGRKAVEVTRALRNIRNGETYKCFKLSLRLEP